MNNSLNKNNKTAQVVMEFTFCMIIVLLMIYGLMMIFRWTGLDLYERRKAHDEELIHLGEVREGYQALDESPLTQIDPYFYTPVPMNAVWEGEY